MANQRQPQVNRDIEVYSYGHYKTNGDLENKLFEWGLLVDGNYCFKIFGEDVLSGTKGIEFYHSIQSILPQNYEKRMMSPTGIPGDGFSLTIPISEFQNNNIWDILKNHFPNSSSNTPKINEDRVIQELSKECISKKLIREHVTSRLIKTGKGYLSMINIDGEPSYFGYLGRGLTPAQCSKLVGEDDFIELYSALDGHSPRAAPLFDLAEPMITMFLTEAKRMDALQHISKEKGREDFLKYTRLQNEAAEDLKTKNDFNKN